MYKFTDTAETTGGIWLSSEALSLDGQTVEDYIDGYHTLTVSGRESLEYEINDDDRPTGVNGMNYYGKRMKGRELEVTFQLVASSAEELIERFRELVNFVKGENRQIRFADEPAAHYTGTIEKLEAPDAGALNITSKMTFYCSDPALEADVTTTVAITADDSGILRKTFNYDGTAVAYPTYKIVHKSENGYIGIAATSSAIEIGNVEEVDGNTYERSEVFVSNKEAPKKFVKSDTCPMNKSWGCERKVELNSNGEIGVGNIDSTTSNKVDGVCYKYTIPADSNGEIGADNFYVYCGLNFVCGRDVAGVAGVYLTDENNAVVAGYQCIKSNRSNYTAKYEMKIGDDNQSNAGVWRTFYFDSRNEERYKNPFRRSGGACSILKNGDIVRFYYNGKHYDYRASALSNKKIYGVYVYLGKWPGSSGWPWMLRAFVHGDASLRKDHVKKWNDVPNRYAAGSVITIDTENDSVKINDIPSNDEIVTGSEFPVLMPGKNTIEVYPSSWCTDKPTVSVEYRKRWL